MTSNKVRYQTLEPFYFKEGGEFKEGSEPVFRGFRPRKIRQATGVIEYTIKEYDRLDLLAHNFYVDSRKWWRILDANPKIMCGADLSLEDYVGETIVIPQASEGNR